MKSLRRGEGTGYIDKPTAVGSIPTSDESCCSSVVEQRKIPGPRIPAARICRVVKARATSYNGCGFESRRRRKLL